MTVPPSSRLSQRLRSGTRKSHRFVENMAFIRDFLRGVVDPDAYFRLLADLRHVYRIQESLIRRHLDRPEIEACWDPRLLRTPSLERDLAYFGNLLGKEPALPGPAAAAYAARLEELSRRDPGLLLSHIYARYLGDLSGGAILARIAVRAMKLPEPDGVRFYRFEEIPDSKEWKSSWKARIDALPLTEERIEELVTEANLVFSLNAALFAERGAESEKGASPWRTAFRLLLPKGDRKRG